MIDWYGDYLNIFTNYLRNIPEFKNQTLSEIIDIDSTFFSKNDFKEAIKDSSVNHIPLYVVRNQ